jgi:ABC-type antimicrobial peptide transport system permease subunit
VEEQIRQASGLPVSDVRAMDEVVSRSTSRERFHMLLMSVFGAAALLLAVIGIYGLMAYSVEQRAQEIGIRMALGAGHSDVRGMVVRQGMVFAVAGLALGLGGAFALARQMSSLLFGVTAFDPVVFSAVPLALGAAALFAVWRPARRASRVDPVAALREG